MTCLLKRLGFTAVAFALACVAVASPVEANDYPMRANAPFFYYNKDVISYNKDVIVFDYDQDKNIGDEYVFLEEEYDPSSVLNEPDLNSEDSFPAKPKPLGVERFVAAVFDSVKSQDEEAQSKEEAQLKEAEDPKAAKPVEHKAERAESKKETTGDVAANVQDQPKGGAPVVNGTHESLDVAVTSWRDLPFKTVMRQAYDYSCGSAAVATLLTHVYGRVATEAEVFKAMFEAGDQEKIRREGFSLLDMRDYLGSLGYKANGYKMSLSSIEKHKVPFIALINRDGYNHFVVVKSINGPYLLVGDPNRGNVVYTKEEFMPMWNGISLVVTSHAGLAKKAFSNEKDWTYARARALPELGEHAGLDSVPLPFPNWQIAPSRYDLLSGVTNVLNSLN